MWCVHARDGGGIMGQVNSWRHTRGWRIPVCGATKTVFCMFGPIPWGHSGPLSSVVVVVIVVDIDAQAAHDSTASDIW